MKSNGIAHKTKRVLFVILFLNALILLKVWHLSVVQKDERKEQAQKPQRRTLVQQASRGLIHDYFHTPLAQNRICYKASVYYSQILQIPRVRYKRNKDDQLIKLFPRKRYIEKLAQLLAKELQLEAQYVEDLIHSKASLFPNTPYTLVENISENTYYRLRMLERDWIGLQAEISTERYYPKGKVAGSILGFMGSINHREYIAISEEIRKLEIYLQNEELFTTLPSGYKNRFEIYQRYRELKEKAYTISAKVGKTGIEKSLEQQLRGYYGKKSYAVDVTGNFLRELPGSKDPIEGQNVELTISAELQEFAEQLLAESEANRDSRSIGYDPNLKKRTTLKQPWIKAGAIVALDPNTGNILALASYPRFDPNDFVITKTGSNQKNKQAAVHKWLETETHIGRIWDGLEPLTRERFNNKKGFYEEKVFLNWSKYLEFALPKHHEISDLLKQTTVEKAIYLQEDFDALCFFVKNAQPLELISAILEKGDVDKSIFDPSHIKDASASIKRLRKFLGKLSDKKDALFFLDLCKLAVYSPGFSDSLISMVGHLSIDQYRSYSSAVLELQSTVKAFLKEVFHKTAFQDWRKNKQTEFLKAKRLEEQERNTYARPYLDYIEQEESRLFDVFWTKHGYELCFSFLRDLQVPNPALNNYYKALKNYTTSSTFEKKMIKLKNLLDSFSDSLAIEFLRTFRHFMDLDRPLYGYYPALREKKTKQLEKHLAAGFYPKHGFGYCRSFAFAEATPFGSTFKLVVAYESLRQNHEKGGKEFSFRMIDRPFFDSRIGKKGSMVVGYTMNHKPYPRYYKGGRLPKSAHIGIGEIDLIKAIEQSSNPYFSILAGDFLKNPEDSLINSSKRFGFGEKTGLDLPGEFRGNLPADLKRNKTGLYSFAIGQHTLLATPLQASLFCSSLVNQGAILKPQIIKTLYGQSPLLSRRMEYDPYAYSYQDLYEEIGLKFPLFTAAQAGYTKKANISYDTEVKRWIFLPPEIRDPILKGMSRVVNGEKGTARASVIRELYRNPELMKQYKKLGPYMIGKTGTAEILHNPNINPSSKPKMYKHIWFNAISFKEGSDLKKDPWEQPELVVTVFLKYGDSGKSAAPIAARIIHKWREISARESAESSLITRSK